MLDEVCSYLTRPFALASSATRSALSEIGSLHHKWAISLSSQFYSNSFSDLSTTFQTYSPRDMATAPVDFDGLLALSNDAHLSHTRRKLLQALSDEEVNETIIYCLTEGVERDTREDIAASLLDEVAKLLASRTSERRRTGTVRPFGK